MWCFIWLMLSHGIHPLCKRRCSTYPNNSATAIEVPTQAAKCKIRSMCSPRVQGHGRPRRVVNSAARKSSSAAQIPFGILWGVKPKLLVPRAESVIKAKNRLTEGHVGCQKGRPSARATIHDRRGSMEGKQQACMDHRA